HSLAIHTGSPPPGSDSSIPSDALVLPAGLASTLSGPAAWLAGSTPPAVACHRAAWPNLWHLTRRSCFGRASSVWLPWHAPDAALSRLPPTPSSANTSRHWLLPPPGWLAASSAETAGTPPDRAPPVSVRPPSRCYRHLQKWSTSDGHRTRYTDS